MGGISCGILSCFSLDLRHSIEIWFPCRSSPWGVADLCDLIFVEKSRREAQWLVAFSFAFFVLWIIVSRDVAGMGLVMFSDAYDG
jgi:hypothetical protein